MKSEDPGEYYIRLVYSKGPNGETKVDYKVRLDTTSCNFGGVRYWFICPLSRNGRSCGRRVSKIYLPPGGRYFGCRHCYDLTYESCQTHDKRIDALIRNPDILQARMNSKDLGGSLLALKAYTKLLGKF